MPGRGRSWRGVGEGNPDRIGTAAIADGSITEADLDSNITSKLNQGGHAIQDEGTPLTQQSNMNFVGAGVIATTGGEDTTIVTIPGGGGGFNAVTTFRYFDDFAYNGTANILLVWDQFGQNPGSLDSPGFDSSQHGTMGWTTSGVSGQRQGLITTSGPLFNGGTGYTLKWNFKLDDATNTVATMGGTNGGTADGTTANAAEGGFDDGAWFSLD